MKSGMVKGQYVYVEAADMRELKDREEAERILIKEKVAEYGIDALDPAEALSLLSGIDYLKLRDYIRRFNLSTLHHYTGIMNLTKKQEDKLKLIYRLINQVNNSDIGADMKLDNSEVAGQTFIKLLSGYACEVFVVACLDASLGVIAIPIVSWGDLSQTAIYIRQVVKIALDHNAQSCMCAHVHPAGTLKPSPPDIDVTKRIRDALALVNVALIDHIIVAGNRFLSMKEQGLF